VASEKGEVRRTLAEGVKMCSAWPFVQGILKPAKLWGARKRVGLGDLRNGIPDQQER